MRVVVVGAGITGLSAAHYLAQGGAEVVLVEKSMSLGGVMRTAYVQGCVLEGGPDSFLASKPWASELIREVGLGGELISSNDAKRVTYVLKHGKLVRLPDGLTMMVPTRIGPLLGTRLLSWGSKLRMGLEYFRRAGAASTDRSVEEFLLDHYGREALDYLAEPLLAGVFGGDPAQLSTLSVLPRFAELETKYGSLTRGVLAEKRPSEGPIFQTPIFQTLKRGLGSLVEALRPLAAPVQGRAEGIERSVAGFRVRVNGEWIASDSVVVACPAPEAALVVASIDRELGELLSAIPYNPALTVALGYRRGECPVSGFGFLVPKRERELLLACTYVHNKFAHRAPDDIAVVRCFLGGSALSMTDASVLEATQRELARIANVHAQPMFSKISRWPQSMAQYSIGHGPRIQRIEEIVRGIPGLCLAGNAYHGIGIPDCIRGAKEAAQSLISGRIPAARTA
jgi:oxygen-dependent protoporphyrinogen oxidase